MITDIQYKIISGAIEQIHLSDMNIEEENGKKFPSELLYSNRMLTILELVYSGNSYYLKIAAQCQHLRRWGVPRSNYPYDRKGYHMWRKAVMEFQLDLTRQLLAESGIDHTEIITIVDILKNQGNKSNRNSTIIVDTACLVFVKWYLMPFSLKHESFKVTDILRKTTKKMTDNGLNLIAKLDLPAPVQKLLSNV